MSAKGLFIFSGAQVKYFVFSQIFRLLETQFSNCGVDWFTVHGEENQRVQSFALKNWEEMRWSNQAKKCEFKLRPMLPRIFKILIETWTQQKSWTADHPISSGTIACFF